MWEVAFGKGQAGEVLMINMLVTWATHPHQLRTHFLPVKHHR